MSDERIRVVYHPAPGPGADGEIRPVTPIVLGEDVPYALRWIRRRLGLVVERQPRTRFTNQPLSSLVDQSLPVVLPAQPVVAADTPAPRTDDALVPETAASAATESSEPTPTPAVADRSPTEAPMTEQLPSVVAAPSAVPHDPFSDLLG